MKSVKWIGYVVALLAGIGGIRGYYWLQEPAAPVPPPSAAAKLLGERLLNSDDWKLPKDDSAFLVNETLDLTLSADGIVKYKSKTAGFNSVSGPGDKKYLAEKYIEARNILETKALLPKDAILVSTADQVAAADPAKIEPAKVEKKESVVGMVIRLMGGNKKDAPAAKKEEPKGDVHPLVKATEDNALRVQTIEEQLTQVEEANRQLREKVEALVKENDEFNRDYIKLRLLIMALNAKVDELTEKKKDEKLEQLPAPKEAE